MEPWHPTCSSPSSFTSAPSDVDTSRYVEIFTVPTAALSTSSVGSYAPARITSAPGGKLQAGERVHGGPGDYWVRDQFFASVYSMVEASAREGGSAQGTNFWVLYDMNGEGQQTDPYRVSFDDWSTFEKIRDHVRRTVCYTHPFPLARCSESSTLPRRAHSFFSFLEAFFSSLCARQLQKYHFVRRNKPPHTNYSSSHAFDTFSHA